MLATLLLSRTPHPLHWYSPTAPNCQLMTRPRHLQALLQPFCLYFFIYFFFCFFHFQCVVQLRKSEVVSNVKGNSEMAKDWFKTVVYTAEMVCHVSVRFFFLWRQSVSLEFALPGVAACRLPGFCHSRWCSFQAVSLDRMELAVENMKKAKELASQVPQEVKKMSCLLCRNPGEFQSSEGKPCPVGARRANCVCFLVNESSFVSFRVPTWPCCVTTSE